MELNGYKIELVNGDLYIYEGEVLIQKTKGNPTKLNNPPFADMDEAQAYFMTTGYGAIFEPAPADPIDPSVAQ